MTLAEKVRQLENSAPAIERLSLPAHQYWNEALHGVATTGATSFPVPLTLGAIWDPVLIREVASAISDEARAIANTRGGALVRVLRGRFLLGEFDPPESVPHRQLPESVIESEEHRELARRAAQESMVLLENSSALLPFDPSLSGIAVPGPYADRVELGGYSGAPSRTVVVLMAGHPVTFRWIAAHAPAILYGWYAGQEGGLAVVDALFGEVNPAGRLPLTLYASTDQLPSILSYSIRGGDAAGIGRTYLYFDETALGNVLYPFGHGLSYSSFAHDELGVCQIDPGTLLVSVHVTNQSDRAGDEVAQLYVRDTAPGVVRPLRSLRGFERVSLDAGASETVTFRLELNELGYWDEAAGRLRLAPGELGIEVGASSRNLRLETTIRTDGTRFFP